MASISSVITSGFGVPGSASLVITDGYGTAGVVVPPVVVQNIVSAGGALFKDKRRKSRVIRYSDFETRDAYEAAVRAAIPMSEVRPYPTIERTVVDDDEDETEVIFMLLKLLH